MGPWYLRFEQLSRSPFRRARPLAEGILATRPGNEAKITLELEIRRRPRSFHQKILPFIRHGKILPLVRRSRWRPVRSMDKRPSPERDKPKKEEEELSKLSDKFTWKDESEVGIKKALSDFTDDNKPVLPR